MTAVSFKTPFAHILPASEKAKTIFDMSCEEIKETNKKIESSDNSHHLVDICAYDFLTLVDSNVSCDRIASVLINVMQTVKQCGPQNAAFNEIFEAKEVEPLNGLRVICPFPHKEDCPIESRAIIIRNRATSQWIRITFSIVHMIQEHGFFGKPPYRIDPQEVIAFFNLQNKNYATPAEPMDVDSVGMEVSRKRNQCENSIDGKMIEKSRKKGRTTAPF